MVSSILESVIDDLEIAIQAGNWRVVIQHASVNGRFKGRSKQGIRRELGRYVSAQKFLNLDHGTFAHGVLAFLGF